MRVDVGDMRPLDVARVELEHALRGAGLGHLGAVQLEQARHDGRHRGSGGRWSSRLGSSPSSAATIALETKFLAPRTEMVPVRGVPPWTVRTSFTAAILALRRASGPSRDEPDARVAGSAAACSGRLMAGRSGRAGGARPGAGVLRAALRGRRPGSAWASSRRSARTPAAWAPTLPPRTLRRRRSRRRRRRPGRPSSRPPSSRPTSSPAHPWSGALAEDFFAAVFFVADAFLGDAFLAAALRGRGLGGRSSSPAPPTVASSRPTWRLRRRRRPGPRRRCRRSLAGGGGPGRRHVRPAPARLGAAPDVMGAHRRTPARARGAAARLAGRGLEGGRGPRRRPGARPRRPTPRARRRRRARTPRRETVATRTCSRALVAADARSRPVVVGERSRSRVPTAATGFSASPGARVTARAVRRRPRRSR